MTVLLAMDRALTGRTIDKFGHMRVARNNIAKVCVSPYRGSEIPRWQELGLDAGRVYQMFRHPDELKKGVDTFNGKPVLIDHLPVTADQHASELVVGTTGTHASFNGEFIDNSITLWEGMAIDGVVSSTKRQLSPAYSYDADMTPGNYRGMQFDGIMRNVVCNHVALVFVGRQGPDVVVGDENTMKTRTALMVSGALAGLVRPLLAQDAKLDLTGPLADVSADTLGDGKALAATIHAAAAPLLAADKALTVEDVEAVIRAVPAVAIAEDALTPTPPTPKPTPAPAPQPTPSPAPVAMDEAAVQQRIDAAVNAATANMAALRTAEREVHPHIGEVVALDSAAAYYEMALDAAKVDHAGITDPAALRAMVKMLPEPGALIAEDTAFKDADHDELFKGAKPLVRS